MEQRSPEQSVGVFTGSFVCEVSVVDNDEKKKKEEMRQYIHVVSTRKVGGNYMAGFFFASCIFLPTTDRGQ